MNDLTHSFGDYEDTSLTPSPCFTAWRESVSEYTHIDAQVWANQTLNMEGLVFYLRKAFPQSTQYHVGSVTGISSSTVRNWLEGISKPSGEHFATLVCLLGPSFLAACISQEQEWITEAEKREQLKKLEASKTAIERDILRLTG